MAAQNNLFSSFRIFQNCFHIFDSVKDSGSAFEWVGEVAVTVWLCVFFWWNGVVFYYFLFFYWDGVVVCRDQRLEAARPLSHFDEAVKTPFQLAPPTAQLHTFNWHPQLHKPNYTIAHLTPPSQRPTQTN